MMMRGLMLLIAGLLTSSAPMALEAFPTDELAAHRVDYHRQQAREHQIFCVRELAYQMLREHYPCPEA